MSMPDLTSAVSIGAARRALAQMFSAAGLEQPVLDARVLVGHALHLDHTALAAAADRSLNADERRRIAALAERRLAREPVARIVGLREFWGDTETLVETALAALDARGLRGRALRIADLGTGSGALLLALLSELPRASGVGTDRSVAALEVARDNAWRLGLGGRAAFVACDFGAALAGAFDLVVANPPYVETAPIAGLPPEVREHEPALALDGGADGLAAYRALAADGRRLLAGRGDMIVELGVGQEQAAAALFAAEELAVESSAAADLGGIARALHGRPASRP